VHKERVVRTKVKAAALVVVFALMGCATYPVTTTVVTQPGKRVTAEKSKFSIFWLTPLPAETAGGLVDELLEKCSGQDLTGVTVSVERAWVIVGENMRIVASGYCVAHDGGSTAGSGRGG
jgi:hypothetical protein